MPRQCRLLSAAVMLAAATAPAHAALPQSQGCVTPAEAVEVMLVIAPDALVAVGKACAASLPAGATLRNPSTGMQAAYRAASDAAWAKTAPIVFRLWPRTDRGASTAGMGHAEFREAIAPGLAGAIQPESCAMAERAVTLLAPLPPRNLAGVLVMLLQIGMADEDSGESSIPFCPAAR